MNPVSHPPETFPVAAANGVVRLGENKEWFWRIDWDEVRESLKSVFEEVTNRTAARWPWMKSILGQSSGTGVPFVYCYCGFEDPRDQAIDPAVLGLLFSPEESSGKAVSIEADLCGESSGMVFVECQRRIVPNQLPEIIAAATELAKFLGNDIDSIYEALQQPALSEG